MSKHARVLVIDDEPMLLKALTRALAKDHDCTTFTDARSALQRIEGGERFDAILCDILMPGMNGGDFFESLLRVDAVQAEKVIFLTGDAGSHVVPRSLAHSTTRLLQKPFVLAAVRTAVAQLLASS